jgi:hypothetical protein
MENFLQRKNYILWVMCISVLMLVGAPVAQAVTLDLDSIKPLKPIEFIPEEEFNATTKLIEQTPHDDEFLSFSVRIPKGWKENTTSLNNIGQLKGADNGITENVLGVVSQYVSPPKNLMRSYFTVEAVELAHEINARNWFIHYVLKSGLSLEQVGFDEDRQVEALYVVVEKDITQVVRVKAIINGSRMVIARYYTPVEVYNEEHVQQAQVIKSFNLENRQRENVEEIKIHGFLGQSYFDYPVSWALSAPRIKSIDRMNAMIYHMSPENKMMGQMNHYLISKTLKTARSEELNRLKDTFIIEDYVLGKLIEAPEMVYNEEMGLGVTQVYSMKSQNSGLVDYELWVSVMENKNYLYIMSLLTPSRKEDFYTWARNTESHEIVLRSIRLEDDSIDQYQFIE